MLRPQLAVVTGLKADPGLPRWVLWPSCLFAPQDDLTRWSRLSTAALDRKATLRLSEKG